MFLVQPAAAEAARTTKEKEKIKAVRPDSLDKIGPKKPENSKTI